MSAPQKGGMSLYANLLDGPDSSSSLSRAPVAFAQDGADKDAPAKKSIDPALRFQPIRRPQVKQPKPKPAFSKGPPAPGPPSGSTPGAAASTATSNAAAQAPQRSTLADWAPTEEDEWLYGNVEKRQRGGRRKKKKKDDDGFPAETDWDEIYDPTRPTNVEEYLRSDERIREIQEWKAVLYAHRRKRQDSYDSDERSDEEEETRGLGNQFAPPASYSFAPPPMSPPRGSDATTGDDAYARRLALSKGIPPPAGSPSPPPPPPEDDTEPPRPPEPGTTISRAPVRYERPQEPSDDGKMDIDDDGDEDYNYIPPPIGGGGGGGGGGGDSEETDAPRSNRPGQAGFAQRLMSKYGWSKGSGLGADESGITSALRIQVEKRRKKPDSEGGGWAEPGGRAKIIGGKRKAVAGEEEGPGPISQVVVLRGMLDGMADVQAEIEAGLGQEIGEECGEKYGRVERLYIDATSSGEGRGVFIKFTNQVSALRAVNELQDRIFNGNAIVAKFYDAENFDKGVYT